MWQHHSRASGTWASDAEDDESNPLLPKELFEQWREHVALATESCELPWLEKLHSLGVKRGYPGRAVHEVEETIKDLKSP